MARSTLNQRLNALLSTRQNQSYALILVTIFIVLILIGVGVFPIISSILYQTEQNALKSEVLTRMETKERNLRTLISTESQKREVSLALNAALPDKLLQSEILDSLNELVERNEVELIFVSFADIQDRRVIQELFSLPNPMYAKTLTIGLNGSRSGLQEFFAELEDLRRVTNVLTVSLSRREANDLVPIPVGKEYTLNVQAEIYFTEEE